MTTKSLARMAFVIGLLFFCFTAMATLQQQLVTLATKVQAYERQEQEWQKKIIDLEQQVSALKRNLEGRQLNLKKAIGVLYRLTRRGVENDPTLYAGMLLRSFTHHIFQENQIVTQELNKVFILQEEAAVKRAHLKKLQTILAEQSQKIEARLKGRPKIKKYPSIQAPDLNTLVQKLSTKKSPAREKSEYVVFPVYGSIVVPFGKVHPHSPDGVGIVFKTPPQAWVFSPVQGDVVFAGPFKSYKNLVIIKHGDAHTLLAGLDRLEVILGQTVEGGEPIGKIFDSYLYLEFRRHQIPAPPPLPKP